MEQLSLLGLKFFSVTCRERLPHVLDLAAQVANVQLPGLTLVQEIGQQGATIQGGGG